jgi:hypothetical protein
MERAFLCTLYHQFPTFLNTCCGPIFGSTIQYKDVPDLSTRVVSCVVYDLHQSAELYWNTPRPVLRPSQPASTY